MCRFDRGELKNAAKFCLAAIMAAVSAPRAIGLQLNLGNLPTAYLPTYLPTYPPAYLPTYPPTPIPISTKGRPSLLSLELFCEGEKSRAQSRSGAKRAQKKHGPSRRLLSGLWFAQRAHALLTMSSKRQWRKRPLLRRPQRSHHNSKAAS